MATYKGKPAIVNASPEQITEKFADLTVLEQFRNNVSADEIAKIGELRFEPDSIIIKNPAVGEIAFKVVERSADRLVFNANGMLPLSLAINLKGIENDSKTEVTTALDIEIPMMLRPILGGKLQQVADSFGDFIGKMAANTSQPE